MTPLAYADARMTPVPNLRAFQWVPRSGTTDRMKLRHASALALVGWYLIAWPLKSTGYLDKTAPLNTWQVENVFDSKRDCEADRYKPYLSSERELKRFLSSHPEAAKMIAARLRVRHDQMTAAQCVSSDDPRLKPK